MPRSLSAKEGAPRAPSPSSAAVTTLQLLTGNSLDAPGPKLQSGPLSLEAGEVKSRSAERIVRRSQQLGSDPGPSICPNKCSCVCNK